MAENTAAIERPVGGSYVLLIRLDETQAVDIGRLGRVRFNAGYYAYVGSALGGLSSRIERHLRRKKKLHWHIDYLLEKAVVEAVITGETRLRTECAIARALDERCESIAGFGASDCRCQSHLFFASEDIRKVVMSAVEDAGTVPRFRPVDSTDRLNR